MSSPGVRGDRDQRGWAFGVAPAALSFSTLLCSSGSRTGKKEKKPT